MIEALNQSELFARSFSMIQSSDASMIQFMLHSVGSHSQAAGAYISLRLTISSACCDAKKRIRCLSPGKLRWITSVPDSLASA